eukprot:111238-Prymnesium_polylepis.1
MVARHGPQSTSGPSRGRMRWGSVTETLLLPHAPDAASGAARRQSEAAKPGQQRSLPSQKMSPRGRGTPGSSRCRDCHVPGLPEDGRWPMLWPMADVVARG